VSPADSYVTEQAHQSTQVRLFLLVTRSALRGKTGAAKNRSEKPRRAGASLSWSLRSENRGEDSLAAYAMKEKRCRVRNKNVDISIRAGLGPVAGCGIARGPVDRRTISPVWCVCPEVGTRGVNRFTDR
jgi:hypothetical protein